MGYISKVLTAIFILSFSSNIFAASKTKDEIFIGIDGADKYSIQRKGELTCYDGDNYYIVTRNHRKFVGTDSLIKFKKPHKWLAITKFQKVYLLY